MSRVATIFLSAVLASVQAQSPAEYLRETWAEMVKAHNAVRAKLNLPPLVWSTKIAVVAQQWADRLAARDEFIHRPKSVYGENMFKIVGSSTSAAHVVKEWADEAGDYDYRSNGCRAVCGHYTQIVWRNTREVGCGVARRAGTEIWVCDYNPPGNWVGQRPF